MPALGKASAIELLQTLSKKGIMLLYILRSN